VGLRSDAALGTPVSGLGDAGAGSFGNIATTARRRPAVRSLPAVSIAAALVATIVVATLALHLVWLIRFRHGYLTEWDESGYMQFSLSDFDALHDHGLIEYLRTVGGRGTFGPFLPAVTALAYPIFGRGVFGSLLVIPLFFVALVLATYGVARRIVSDGWAVVAALAVSAIPGITDYTRIYHFAVPTTACMTATLWAFLRSDELRRTRWALVAGVFLGLTMLTRTMALGYLPGLVAAAVVLCAIGTDERRLRVRNLGVAGVAAVVVTGPWYLRNARSVYEYLIPGGYGAEAIPYGRHYPVVSWGYWTKELRFDLYYLSFPIAVALAACFAAALVYAILRRRLAVSALRLGLRTGKTAAVVALALVVLEGYLVLTSSRNEGTAFALPWLPALVVLGVAAAAALPPRGVRVVLATGLIVASVGAVLSKSGWVARLATARSVSVPGLGSVVVTDGRGIIQDIVAGAGYDIGPPTHPLPKLHRRWLPVEHEVVGWSLDYARSRGQRLHMTLGLDDLLFGNSRLILAAQLWYHRFLPVDYLRSFPDGDTVASYRRQLVSPRPENELITGEERPGRTITQSKVEAAARSLGFARVKSFTLPDRRKIWIWWRDDVGNRIRP
jgi:Dolichyl-phosphate-mannose-protein mannosyltransferase